MSESSRCNHRHKAPVFRAPEWLESIPPYRAGKHRIDGGEGIEGKTAKPMAKPIILSANENPYGPAPSVIEMVRNCAGEQHRYPESVHSGLISRISEIFGIAPEFVSLGNGADEIILTLSRLYAGPNTEILHSAYGFSYYATAAAAAGARPVAAPETQYHADCDAVLRTVSTKTRIVFLANPNNPTGTLLAHEEIVRLQQNLPENILLVLDSAYAEFAADHPQYNDGMKWAITKPNCLVLRTCSKLYGIAGLRIGWAVANRSIIESLERVRMPFNINALALKAAERALCETEWTQQCLRRILASREKFVGQLSRLGIKTLPAWGNFVTLVLRDAAEANALYESLLKESIITREIGMLPNMLRISIGKPDEMAACLKAIQNWKNP